MKSGLQELAECSKAPLSGPQLRARALRLLARREHSRAELQRKLLSGEVDQAALDAVLGDLESRDLLSDRRYAEVTVHSKRARYGIARIVQTLSRQGVDAELAAQVIQPLKSSERERALALWQKRFGEPAADLKGRARQHRFLLGRGFDPATVAWVLKQARNSQPET
ncbi:MAG: recombination regulator RecX [Lautropia sp.]